MEDEGEFANRMREELICRQHDLHEINSVSKRIQNHYSRLPRELMKLPLLEVCKNDFDKPAQSDSISQKWTILN